MSTLKDVAREAGVSVTTASRALNNFADVATATRERVHRVARALDYHPNSAARSLQNSRTGAIGLVIPLVLHRAHDPFWFDFIGGMATAVAERGVDLLISAADGHAAGGVGFERLLRGRRVDGLLICDILQDDARIPLLQCRQIPFVAFGRTVGRHDYPYVDVDGEAGIRGAVEHLVRLGHRRIAYFGVAAQFGFSYYRLQGYCSALATAGIPYDERLVAQGLSEAEVETVLGAMLGLPDQPTAVLAAADFLAAAVTRAARRMDLAIPGQLSLIAFDDSPVVQHAEPRLTTITQPNRRLGEEAAHLLMDRVECPDGPLVQRLVVPALVVRRSTDVPLSMGGGDADQTAD